MKAGSKTNDSAICSHSIKDRTVGYEPADSGSIPDESPLTLSLQSYTTRIMTSGIFLLEELELYVNRREYLEPQGLVNHKETFVVNSKKFRALIKDRKEPEVSDNGCLFR